ncbi:flagellar hook-length control protein FliK [Ramlibacter sp. H39-3-26]|uniref:flagellar hook-length control protein FliK n=1 Tax=Curvibacter soli TaxID=3031331 RepID=UPI0023DB0D1D|nr:flagellar hook-length control protein FliK [Ramlibacter sp. H39-3-26]MDF1485768.1 flagellar hook-length control protein FliK [Ramlibacter sp. H39-3-26]
MEQIRISNPGGAAASGASAAKAAGGTEDDAGDNDFSSLLSAASEGPVADAGLDGAGDGPDEPSQARPARKVHGHAVAQAGVDLQLPIPVAQVEDPAMVAAADDAKDGAGKGRGVDLLAQMQLAPAGDAATLTGGDAKVESAAGFGAGLLAQMRRASAGGMEGAVETGTLAVKGRAAAKAGASSAHGAASAALAAAGAASSSSSAQQPVSALQAGRRDAAALDSLALQGRDAGMAAAQQAATEAPGTSATAMMDVDGLERHGLRVAETPTGTPATAAGGASPALAAMNTGPATLSSPHLPSAAIDTTHGGAEEAIAEQVGYWVRHNTQNAELTLDPGGQRIDVHIALQGNEAHVTFRSDQAQTRDLLDSSASHLRDMLRSEGLVLSGVSVGASGAHAGNPGASGEREAGRSGARQTQVAAVVPAGTAAARGGMDGSTARTLDVFA